MAGDSEYAEAVELLGRAWSERDKFRTELAARDATIARLREALEPFARRAVFYHGILDRQSIEYDNAAASTSGKCPPLTVAMLRAARDALLAAREGGE